MAPAITSLTHRQDFNGMTLLWNCHMTLFSLVFQDLWLLLL